MSRHGSDGGTRHITTRTIASSLRNLPLWAKKVLMLAVDMVLLPLALWLSYCLRLGEWYHDFAESWFLFALLPLITVPIFARLGLYRAVLRYSGQRTFQIIARGALFSSAVVLVMTLVMGPAVLPRSIFAIYALVAILVVAGTRVLARFFLLGLTFSPDGQRVAIYGAGAAGRQLVRLLHSGHLYQPIAFFDDNETLHGREIEGLRVYGPAREDLKTLLSDLGITQVLLAIPSAPRSVRQKILERLEALPVHVRTVPGIEQMLTGSNSIELQEVQIEDLLGREPVPPNPALLGKCITGLNVMVTGAGGSIGSELCRQIIRLQPRMLLLLEHSEFALYQIEAELKAHLPESVKLVSVLGSVADDGKVRRLLEEHHIETIYHAAAYKHVPLVETNTLAGVANNIFGTKVLALAAGDLGVRNFVLISTDKAVRPTNVMGATKRVAELVLQALGGRYPATCFCMVRFGNVLNSSGSVVPLFRRQIERGGPVTVTHPEVTRYFMTIPEAVQLVIQAGSMAQGGDVFVLDMGSPVRILDMAKKMIHLSGLSIRDEAHPEGDIEIVISGLRPGEKLYEELLIGSNVYGTEHPKIMRAQEDWLPWDKLSSVLEGFAEAIASDNPGKAIDLFTDVVNGYSKSPSLTESATVVAKAGR